MAYTPVNKSADKEDEKQKDKDAMSKTEEDVPGYEAPHGSPMHGIKIKGEEKTGKGETRLFQTDDPGTKEWMTEEQAKKAGKYWKPSEDPKKDPTQKEK